MGSEEGVGRDAQGSQGCGRERGSARMGLRERGVLLGRRFFASPQVPLEPEGGGDP